MKYLEEYRDAEVAAALLREIRRVVKRPWVIMEVCGGQTHSIVRYGIDRVLPVASRPDVIFTSFGDMLRVPGSRTDLLALRGRGSDVRVVYSPLDAVTIARENPLKKVVFLGIGFETTAP